jgi:hypothetical protein
MNAYDLAAKIKLTPRAVVLSGRIDYRQKQGMPALTPHYAEKGCPIVQYQGANAIERPNAAEIEFGMIEAANPVPAIARTFPKQKNLCMLIYGHDSQAPTQAAYRVLQEASSIFGKVGQQDVHVAALPVTTPAMGGINNGRFVILGLFDAAGRPLWLNPDANDAQAFQGVPYPDGQAERSASNAPASAQAAVWYNAIASVLAGTGLKGDALRSATLNARARQLVDEGTAPTVEAALAMATADAPGATVHTATTTAAAPAPTASRKKVGAQLRGRK